MFSSNPCRVHFIIQLSDPFQSIFLCVVGGIGLALLTYSTNWLPGCITYQENHLHPSDFWCHLYMQDILHFHICLGLYRDFLVYSSGLFIFRYQHHAVSFLRSKLDNLLQAPVLLLRPSLSGSPSLYLCINLPYCNSAHFLCEFLRTQGSLCRCLSVLSGAMSSLPVCKCGYCFPAQR